MITRFEVNEASVLPNGTAMVRGTVVEGPRLTVGQRGETTAPNCCFIAEVVGVGVVDPNLDTSGRQGLLLSIIEGDVKRIKGVTLLFDSPQSPTTASAEFS